MTTKLEQAARQALEALEEAYENGFLTGVTGLKTIDTITALREALDHSADAGNKVSDHIADAGKLMLTTEQAQQIEEALDELRYANNTDIAKTKYYKALSIIRAARAQEQAEQEPVGRWNWNEAKFEWLTKFDYHKHHMTPLYAAPQPVMQELVAWAHPSGGYLSARYMKEFATGLEKETYTIPLYAAPVRTKDLTDDEIEDAVGWTMTEQSILDCRAVIAADREKNK